MPINKWLLFWSRRKLFQMLLTVVAGMKCKKCKWFAKPKRSKHSQKSKPKLKESGNCLQFTFYTNLRRVKEHSKSWIHLFSPDFSTRCMDTDEFHLKLLMTNDLFALSWIWRSRNIFCFQCHVLTGLHVPLQSIKHVLVCSGVCVRHSTEHTHTQHVYMKSCEWNVCLPGAGITMFSFWL